MENREKYFLRKPVEYQINGLIQALETISKEYADSSSDASHAYDVCARKLREIFTEIIRTDNHSVVKLNELSLEGWENFIDKIHNSHKNN